MDFLEQYEDLANGIVTQAARDLAQAIVNEDENQIKAEEEFFNGKWCQVLTAANTEFIVRKVREGAEQFSFIADNAFEYLGDYIEEPKKVFVCPICGGAVWGKHIVKPTRIRPFLDHHYNRLVCLTCDLYKDKYLYASESKRTKRFKEENGIE